MEVFDKHYFSVNKRLLASAGIWPYEHGCKKFLVRVFINILFGIFVIMPQLARIYIFLGVNVDRVLFHSAALLYSMHVYLKFVTSIYFEKKLKIMYDNIAKNWQAITDEDELKILVRYSERGWMLTMAYIVYIIFGGIGYILLPMVPVLLDVFDPRNQTRNRYYLFDGEYFIVDNVESYGKVYAFEVIPAAVSGWLIAAVDPMYAICIEHCLGLFAIVRLRLQLCTQPSWDDRNDVPYKLIVKLIRLHKDIINFADILESSYSSIFFFLVANNVIFLTFECIVVLTKAGDPMELIRYSMIMVGIVIHLFYISWPGQKLTDYSLGILQDAYNNEWYACSTRAQKLLCLMAVRCLKPCQLTAGGIYIMNFSNFATIVKTSLSYITVFSSFR